MGRPIKNGLDYFPLDVNIDQDDKVAMIEALHGQLGFAIIIKILMKIYQQGYYYEWTEKEQILFSKRINVDINSVNAVINDCVKWGMFEEPLFNEYKILTSKGIQKRFLEVCKRRNELELIENYLLIAKKDLEKFANVVFVDINGVNVDINRVNVYIGTESKVKESKVKESKVKESKVKESNYMSVITDVPDTNPKPNFEEILLYWNQRSMLKEITAITDKRKNHLNARAKEHGLDAIYKVIDNTALSSFMRGQNKQGWMATFDWVFLPNNFVKVLEGNYLDKKQSSHDEINQRAQKVKDELGIKDFMEEYMQ